MTFGAPNEQKTESDGSRALHLFHEVLSCFPSYTVSQVCFLYKLCSSITGNISTPASPTSSPKESNVQLISYAQSSPKIVFLGWKPKRNFNRLSSGTQWVASSLLSSKPSCMKCSFLPKNHRKCPLNESAPGKHKEGGYLSQFETPIGCHGNKLCHIVPPSVPSSFPSCGRQQGCHMAAII